MRRHLRLFALYFAQYAKVRLAYKADFFIAFFSSMTATVIGFGFVLVLFTKIPTLQGWSFYEILFLYAFSLVPLGFFNVVSWNLYEFGDIYIIQGHFDRILLRPVDTLFQVLFEKFRIESLRSEEHTSELQSRLHLVCRLLLEKKKKRRRTLLTVRRLHTSATRPEAAHVRECTCTP